jgi:hypothetical protein
MEVYLIGCFLALIALTISCWGETGEITVRHVIQILVLSAVSYISFIVAVVILWEDYGNKEGLDKLLDKKIISKKNK